MPGKGRPKKKGRARKGTGHIREPRPGYFTAEIGLGTTPDGKRIRRTVTGRSPEEVEAKLDELRSQARRGRRVPSGKVTVADHFRDWLRGKKPDVASATYGKYERLFETHVEPFLGKVPLLKLDYSDVNLFYEHLDKQDLERNTIASIASVLRMGLEDAVRKRRLYENPARLASKRSPARKKARFMDQEEIAALFPAMEGERLEPLFTVMFHTGMRPGEAIGLPWRNVDLRKRTVKIDQALHEEGPDLYIGELKGESQSDEPKARTITLPQAAVAALKKQRAMQNREQLAAKTWSNPNGLVFTDRKGGYLRRTNILRRDFKRIKDRVIEQTEGKVKLEGVTLHTFRHTHASVLIFQGQDIKVISERLGHSDIKFTYQTYGHLLPGSDERAADAMDRFIESLGKQ